MTLADDFREFAAWAEGTSPLYARLAPAVADDDDLLALCADRLDGQPAPHLLFAAVQSLLFERPDEPLAAHYPSVTDGAAEGDPAPAFREFCLAHEDAVRRLVGTRRTQTNAVGRCSVLLPAFEFVSRRVGREPLSLVEVGASAGLNLRWDGYAYEYDGDRVGPTDASVTLRTARRGGEPPVPATFPEVADRRGLDLSPIDVRNPDDARWLRALVWPEHVERHRTLAGAIEDARADPPALVAGDALDLLPAVVADLPDPVVVFDTQVRYQLTDRADERYRRLLRDLADDRSVHWLSGHEAVDERTLGLSWTDFETDARLASYEQHGRWLRWEAQAPL